MEVKCDALGSIEALILKEGQSLCKEFYRKNILKLIEVILFAVGRLLCTSSKERLIAHKEN